MLKITNDVLSYTSHFAELDRQRPKSYNISSNGFIFPDSFGFWKISGKSQIQMPSNLSSLPSIPSITQIEPGENVFSQAFITIPGFGMGWNNGERTTILSPLPFPRTRNYSKWALPGKSRDTEEASTIDNHDVDWFNCSHRIKETPS